MNVFDQTEACAICLQISQFDLISLHSHSSIEISNSQGDNGHLKAEAIIEETQIVFMLTDISGLDFNSKCADSSSGICENCVKDLTTAYKFKKRCSIAFQQLASHIPKSKTAKNEESVKGEADFSECSESAMPDFSNFSELDEFEHETKNIPIEMVEIDEINVDNDTNKSTPVRELKCSVCNKLFSRKTHLQRHMTVHTDERAFECTEKGCGSRFRRRDHLNNHIQNVHKHSQTKHECTYCQQTYSKANHLRRHIKAQHTQNEPENEESAVICVTNQFTNNSLDAVKDEPNSTHAETRETQKMGEANKAIQKFECDLCQKAFVRKTHLKRHMTVHSDERAFKCTETGCDSRFRRLDHLRNHLNTHSQLKIHKCATCGKSFARIDHLKNHELRRHSEKMPKDEKDLFNCSVCEKSFISQKNLNSHEKSHNRIVNCKRCDAQFTSTIELKKHVSEVHPNDLKVFLCNECGVTCSRYDYLLIHMRRHRGETRYHCKYCQKGFFRTTDLRVHEKYHTDEKTHVCFCGKKFARRYNLTLHQRVHTGEKPFVCTHTNCSAAFSQSNDLKVHMRRHTGERFKCDVDHCNDSFIQMYLLTRHKRDVHGIEVQSNIKRLIKFIPMKLPEESVQPSTIDE